MSVTKACACGICLSHVPHLTACPSHTQAAAHAEASRRLASLPARLTATLLPFQLAGVAHILRRRGRCLLADEPGVGKTLQAIASYVAYSSEGPLCVVVPASLRLQWADELERHVIGLHPGDLTLIFTSADKALLDDLPRKAGPTGAGSWPPGRMRAVVISYNMLAALRHEMVGVAWGLVVCDESHTMRTTLGRADSDLTEAAAALVKGAMRAVLLTGTPSLNRPFDIYRQVDALCPGLLGASKWDFGDAYCESKVLPTGRSASGGCRLHELHLLLSATCYLLRRTKADVAAELPPKRRTVVRLTLAAQSGGKREAAAPDDCPPEIDTAAANGDEAAPRTKSVSHITGLRKIGPTCEWLFATLLRSCTTNKVVIFAHHKAVMNGIQEALERAAQGDGATSAWYVRIDGETDALNRAAAVSSFSRHPHVRCALLSVRAAGTGLDFSAASAVVFAELPLDASDVLQAEARVHRRGCQRVNVYFICARGTDDETRWTDIAARLTRVAAVHNGPDSEPAECGAGGPTSMVLDVDSVVEAHQPGGDASCSAPDAVAQTCAPADPGSSDTEPPTDVAMPSTHAQPLAISAAEAAVESISKSRLRFQVSGHTNRLHIFIRREVAAESPPPPDCGADADDVSPEESEPELEHVGSVHRCDLEAVLLGTPPSALPWPLSTRASCRLAARAFWTAFDGLTASQRRDLNRAGGPTTRASLRAAAEAAKASLVASAPLQRRPASVRRTAKLADVAPPPPEGALARYVTLCPPLAPHTAHARTQWVTSTGSWLCVACNTAPARVQHRPESATDGVISSDLTVSTLLDLCCGAPCLEWMQLRTCPAALRAAVFARDRGVCATCSLDCNALHQRIKPLSEADRRRVVVAAAPTFGEQRHAGALAALCATGHAGRLWQADHMLAVIDGGGLCGLENMRTLCVACHTDETTRLASRRAAERRDAAEAEAPPWRPPTKPPSLEDDDDFMSGQKIKTGKKKRKQAKEGTTRNIVALV
jgi:5-methylcytosine-specific restriction endonuclease McrA